MYVETDLAHASYANGERVWTARWITHESQEINWK